MSAAAISRAVGRGFSRSVVTGSAAPHAAAPHLTVGDIQMPGDGRIRPVTVLPGYG